MSNRIVGAQQRARQRGVLAASLERQGAYEQAAEQWTAAAVAWGTNAGQVQYCNDRAHHCRHQLKRRAA
ncbi:ANR family transcriptional regulator [Ferrimonas balearica]|uniref:ANR family transcriptional regulator n=1 Tax=Ferrimonas balearica TaxID=44012 RepID=UPI001C9668D4|nr:ANR family transcriptional regulator [Ferrimonas balearica]MBY6104878.1 ANR family transcriptional regulator [Ferrimonas balearica]